MEKLILQDVSPLERKKYLRDSAHKTEKFTYPRPLDESEVTRLKDEFTQNAISLAKEEEKKAEFMVDWKAEVKPLKETMKGQMTRIRARIEEKTEEVFLLAEHGDGMMGYYNSEGLLVYSRPLMPDERQFSIVDSSDLIKTKKA